jgi:1-acyl-sn-glycerol-3-phosphate acyltransferase
VGKRGLCGLVGTLSIINPVGTIQWLKKHMFGTIGYYIGWMIIAVIAKVILRKNVLVYAPVPEGPKILVANHPTVSDPFVLLTSIRDRISVLVWGQVFSIPLFGRYLKMSGHIPVVQGEGYKGFNSALHHLQHGTSVLVFIEGGISPDGGGYGNPKTGAVRLACHSGAPIVPIGVGIHKKNIHHIHGIIGGEKIRETWYFHGKYAITIGKHFHVTVNPKDRSEVREATQHVMRRVIKLAEESATRIHT